MGNRSFLYITRPGKSAGREEIAEANNNFPIIWQVLLAGGSESKAIEDQRVFGNAKTPNLAADANAGLARFKKLAAYLIKHPQAKKMKWLPLYCDGVAQHLKNLINTYTEGGKKAPIFSANLDEMSWFDAGSSNDYISQTLAICDVLWQNLDDAIARENYDLIDEYLGFARYQQKFTEWDAWTYEFGFCNFQHPYFQLSFEGEPRKIAFEKFDPSDDDIDLLEFFEVNGKWGIKSPLGKVILEPTYDEMYRHEKESELAVVKLNEKFGYIDRYGKLAIPLEFDDAFDFFKNYEKSAQRAAVVKNDLHGLVNRFGDWIVTPTYEDLAGTDDYGSNFSMQQNGLWGVMDGDGNVLLAPSLPHVMQGDRYANFYFTQADENSPKTYYSRHLLPLKTAPEWTLSKAYDDENYMIEVQSGTETLKGLLDDTGQVILAPEYTELSFYRNETVNKEKWYHLIKNKKHGLYQLDKGWQIDCEYDLIKNLQDQYSENIKRGIRLVKKGKKWGIYDAAKSAWLLACEADDYIEFHKQTIGIYYGAKHAKSGWWVQTYANFNVQNGPFERLFELRYSYFDFAEGLAFGKNGVMTLSAEGAKPLNKKQADLLLEKLPTDFYYQRHVANTKESLTDEQWALIAAAGSSKSHAAMLGIRANALFEAEDFSQALVLYLQMAELGNVEGMVHAGYIYETTKQDFVQAHDWYKRAMDAGNLAGKNNYAAMLHSGKGCKANTPQAIALYKEASDAGFMLSSKNLAEIYTENEAYQDYALALKYYLKAYKEYPNNECIGFIYNHLEDYSNAEKYYKLAVKDGSGYALLALGNLWADGSLGKVDIEKARQYYLKAQKTSYDKEATTALAELG